MSEEKKYKNYTAADIEKYQKGLLSPKEMNELEKAALDDPFLADALEGYESTSTNISSDLSELKKKLAERVSDRKVIGITSSRSFFKWWKVAAAVVVIGGLGYFVFQISTGIKNKEVATLEKKQNQPQAPMNDSGKIQSPLSDSALNSKSSQYVIPDNQMVTTKSRKEKPSSKESPTSEASKSDDLDAAAITTTQPAQNYKDERDSLHANRPSVLVAPASVEKYEAVAADREKQGALNLKKEAASDQQKENYFSGRIKDANNNPLPFANITNTRDNVGTYADAQGRFTLVSPDSVLDVQVRSVGFENSKVKLKNNVAINEVVLQESKTVPDKVLSLKKPDTNRSGVANITFEELEPADGWSNYNTYLANNINVPGDLRSKEAQGQVQISFEVNPQGSPVNIRVEKSLCSKCDEEAVRVVKQGPKWKKKSNKAKRITITVPFDTEQ